MARVLAWFSAGAASAVATKLAIAEHGDAALPVYCATNSEHADNARFRADCEAWFGRPVTVIQSDRYTDTWDVWQKRRYLAGIKGALCTTELKVMPRLSFQRPDDVHVFGYTADAGDAARAVRFREHWPEVDARFPLIDGGVTKAACLAMVERAGIALPVTYAMGFPNANCLPCVKATSPAYWALVRERFPDTFRRIADRIRIPAEFWKVLSKRDQRRIMETSTLDAEDCATLWALLGRDDAPPEQLAVQVRTDDVMRIWPPPAH